MYKYLIIILQLFSLYGLSQDPYHIDYTMNDGLPSFEVYDLYVDKNNKIWGATDRGVFNYDGYEFNSFNTKDGLSNNTIFKVLPDVNGKLWFNGMDGSLSFFENGVIKQSIHNEALQSIINRTWYNDIGFDSLGNYYTYQSKNTHALVSNDIIQLNADGSITKKVDYFDGFVSYPLEGFTLYYKHFTNTSFFFIPEYNLFVNKVLKVTDNEYLFYISESNNNFNSNHKRTIEYENKSQLYVLKDGQISRKLNISGAIQGLFVDKNKDTYLLTNKGILKYECGDFDIAPKQYFKSSNFSSMVRDLDGNYWASTVNNGIMIIPTFEYTSPNLNQFSDQNILSLKVLDNKLYFGMNRIGPFYLDRQGNIHTIEGVPSDCGVETFELVKDRLYFGGSHYLDVANSLPKCIHFDAISLSSTIIRKLPNGDLFLDKTDKYYIRSEDKLISGFKTKTRIKTVKVGKDHIWIGTLNGLFKVSLEDYTQFSQVVDDGQLLDIRINNIQTDKYDNIFIATIGNGLVIYDNTNNYLQLNKQNGIASDLVNCAFVQNDSILWIGTNQGLSKLKLHYKGEWPSVKEVVNYTTMDGLPGNFINDIIFFNDKIWLATNNGLHGFRHDYEPNQDVMPLIQIDRVEIEGDSTNFEEGIKLAYDQNYINFLFTSIGYKKPTNNVYRYALSRNDGVPTWTMTNGRNARFTNLSPGNYTFSVSARNIYDKWSLPESMSFNIKPHFTATWWFGLTSFLFTIGLVFWIYKYRLNSLIEEKQKERGLEEAKLKTRIAELSTFQNQFNPHFVFNALNSIQNYIFKNDIRQANSFLSKFAKLIRESLNLTNEKLVPIRREFQFLESYLNLELLRFPNKFLFVFINEEDIPLDLYLIPPMLMQPVIENVLKHAFTGKENGNLMIDIKCHKDQESWIISIVDDGHGLKEPQNESDKSDKRKSFGLKIINDRLALLNLDYPAVHSSFTIKNRSKNNGTRVEFVIPKIHLEDYD